jgi:hypothetical protein
VRARVNASQPLGHSSTSVVATKHGRQAGTRTLTKAATPAGVMLDTKAGTQVTAYAQRHEASMQKKAWSPRAWPSSISTARRSATKVERAWHAHLMLWLQWRSAVKKWSRGTVRLGPRAWPIYSPRHDGWYSEQKEERKAHLVVLVAVVRQRQNSTKQGK